MHDVVPAVLALRFTIAPHSLSKENARNYFMVYVISFKISASSPFLMSGFKKKTANKTAYELFFTRVLLHPFSAENIIRCFSFSRFIKNHKFTDYRWNHIYSCLLKTPLNVLKIPSMVDVPKPGMGVGRQREHFWAGEGVSCGHLADNCWRERWLTASNSSTSDYKSDKGSISLPSVPGICKLAYF